MVEYHTSSKDKEFRSRLKEHPEEFRAVILQFFATRQEANEFEGYCLGRVAARSNQYAYNQSCFVGGVDYSQGPTQSKEDIAEWQKQKYKENREARIEKVREYYEGHREQILEYQKEYAEKNKESLQEYRKKYYELNHDKRKEYRAAYYAANREEAIQKQKSYYAEHAEVERQRTRDWVKQNQERKKENDSKYYEKNKEKLKQRSREKYQELVPIIRQLREQDPTLTNNDAQKLARAQLRSERKQRP